MRLVVRMHLAQLHAGVGEAVALELVFHCYPCTLLPDRGCGRCSLSALQRGRKESEEGEGQRGLASIEHLRRSRTRTGEVSVQCDERGNNNATRGETCGRGSQTCGMGVPCNPHPASFILLPPSRKFDRGSIAQPLVALRTQRTHPAYAPNVRTQRTHPE